MTDCDGENSETETWLDFALNCEYLNDNDYKKLVDKNNRIGQMLGNMMVKAEIFCKK